MRETALANGQRSQWVGRFMRVRPSVPTRPGLLKQLGHTPASARCEGSLSTGSQTGPLARESCLSSGLNVQSGHRKCCAGRPKYPSGTGRLVNSVFWDSSRTCHLGLVPVETRLRLEDKSARLGQHGTLSQQCERCSARRKSHTRTLVDGADLPNWWGFREVPH